MEFIKKRLLVIMVASSLVFYSCGPTDNKGSMDEKNSSGEGAIDSTRLTNFDTSSMTGASDSGVLK